MDRFMEPTLSALQSDLYDWMKVGGQTINTRPTTVISDHDRVLRCRLLLEETLEFIKAMGCWVDEMLEVHDDHHPTDLVEAADAIADVMVINLGNAVTLGIDVAPVYGEVMTSNWAKFVGGVVLRDSTGKITKPEGWQPPDIARMLADQGYTLAEAHCRPCADAHPTQGCADVGCSHNCENWVVRYAEDTRPIDCDGSCR